MAFSSDGINVVPDDNGGGIYVRDLQAGTTAKVSATSSGQQASALGGDYLSISADGRYVAFQSLADNLVANDTNGSGDGQRQDSSDVFLHERQVQNGTPPNTTTPPDTTLPSADIVTPPTAPSTSATKRLTPTTPVRSKLEVRA